MFLFFYCIVIVAVAVPPIESDTLRVAVPAVAVAGTATVMEAPFHIPSSPPSRMQLFGVPPPAPLSLKARVMLLDDVVYAGVPPLIVKVKVEHRPAIVEAVGGFMASAAGVGGGITGAVMSTVTESHISEFGSHISPISPILAVIVAVTLDVTSAAVNSTSATPSVVCAKGAIPPLDDGLTTKFTVVPSGAGVPALVKT